ncbi:MAG TPA: Ku protein [Gammaproteobacteria bacterium]|nr:Ku protein [Gammaproteobacteria bacterium]
MPRKGQNDSDKQARRPGPRPFWSGIIAFGLVSLPVSLFVATRSNKVSLRMIDEDGEPLARRYFCPSEERPLEADEIARGYEVDKNEFVVVSDDELDAIAPPKSQEIDLRRFVPADDIDPMYFERAYFLAPDQGAIKPYRLLARSMEDTGRAGIATCVIRGKEYLIAILSSRGILRAEILRFADELRSPDDVGLGEPAKADSAAVKQIEKAIKSRSRKTLDDKQMIDARAERIRKRVEEKLKADEDVIRDPDYDGAGDADEPTDTDPIDLMAVLKASLQQESGAGGKKEPKRKAAQHNGGGRKQPKARSRDELYEQAQKLDIAGRSKMNKAELAQAIDAARRT